MRAALSDTSTRSVVLARVVSSGVMVMVYELMLLPSFLDA
jgi:hypothetical protein